MPRLIDADELVHVLEGQCMRTLEQGCHPRYTKGMKYAIDLVKREKIVDPVKHGHWIFDEQWWYPPVCSVCKKPAKTPGYIGDYAFYREHFPCCPHCGAKLF